MKKMLLATAFGLYYRMCSTDVLLFKMETGSSTKGNHHPSFLRLNWARRKLADAAKFVAAQKMLLKQKPSKHS